MLHGKADQFARYAAMERAIPAIAPAHLVARDGDHFSFRDDVASFLREVTAFLDPP